MSAWRNLLALTVALLLAGSAGAQTVDLSEGPLVDNFFRVSLTMTLEGKISVQQDKKFEDHPLKVAAEHVFLEKVLDDKKLAAGGVLVERSARIYKKAQAISALDGKSATREFRRDRTFLVAQRLKGSTLTYCPTGNLNRDEIDLTEHFNTLGLTGLLPGKEVKVGDSWKVSTEVAQMLCGMDAVTRNELTCELKEVTDRSARVVVKGAAAGIELGADVAALVEAEYEFDRKDKRLTSLTWQQDDQRNGSPVTPILSAKVSYKLQRTGIDEPTELNDNFLKGTIPAGKTPPADLTRVEAGDPGKRFELQHSREWIATSQDKHHTVLRFMKEGKLVAQATVTPWPTTKDGKMLAFDTFEEELKNTPTWEEKEVIAKNDKVNVPAGRQAYLYSARGDLDGKEVVQYFYLIAGEQGQHVVVTFTMNQTTVQDLGTLDNDFIQNLSFPSVTAPTSAPEKTEDQK